MFGRPGGACAEVLVAPRQLSGSCGRWRRGRQASRRLRDGPAAGASVRRWGWSQASALPRARPRSVPAWVWCGMHGRIKAVRSRIHWGAPLSRSSAADRSPICFACIPGWWSGASHCDAGRHGAGRHCGHLFSRLSSCGGYAGRRFFGVQMAALDAACSPRGGCSRGRWGGPPFPTVSFGGRLSIGLASFMASLWRPWMRLPPTLEGGGLGVAVFPFLAGFFLVGVLVVRARVPPRVSLLGGAQRSHRWHTGVVAPSRPRVTF